MDLRRIRSGGHPVAATLLLDAKLEVVALELELAELVLPHHLEDLLDFVEIHQLLEDEEVAGHGCEYVAARVRHQHVVLDPHTAKARNIRAGLDRKDHPRLERD